MASAPILMLLLNLAPESASRIDPPYSARCFVENVYVGDRKCVDFDYARPMEGIWINSFEGSRFFPNARTSSDIRRSHADIWFTLDQQSVTPTGWTPKKYHWYRIRILGRPAHDMHRSAPKVGYGHLGGSEGLVIVDRLNSVVDLGWAPKAIEWPRVVVHELSCNPKEGRRSKLRNTALSLCP